MCEEERTAYVGAAVTVNQAEAASWASVWVLSATV